MGGPAGGGSGALEESPEANSAAAAAAAGEAPAASAQKAPVASAVELGAALGPAELGGGGGLVSPPRFPVRSPRRKGHAAGGVRVGGEERGAPSVQQRRGQRATACTPPRPEEVKHRVVVAIVLERKVVAQSLLSSSVRPGNLHVSRRDLRRSSGRGPLRRSLPL